jgi:thiosulfate dehydrogenase [quinone] large subunit
MVLLARIKGVTMAVEVTGAADPLASRPSRVLVTVLRIGVALLWVQNASWKIPPRFGEGPEPSGLYRFTLEAVEHPVFPPYSWLVEHLVLPNFVVFGWAVLATEAALGAFLLIGLATRLWALIGVGQTVAITLSVLNAPNEWHWSYLLMLLAHLALVATAAGRYAGLDAALRPRWLAAPGRLARLLVRAS